MKFWKGRNVLVTGATGIVGSWLVKELINRGARVTSLVLDADPQSELYRSGDVQHTTVVLGKLQDLETLERAIHGHEIDTVFHLGAQAIVGAAQRSPLDTFESNIRGTYNLLEACRTSKGLVRRVVVASSDKAYGTHKKLPYTETMPLQGREPYEVSKSCADLLTQSYAHAYALPAAVARCGNIYGGGDLNWSRIVPATIRSLYRRERPIVRSDGKFTRDYLYVVDVVRAYMLLAEKMNDKGVRGESFNFGPQKPLTVLQIVKAVQKAVGGPTFKPIVQNKAKGEIRNQYLSSTKARKRLGWKPSFKLEDGLRDTVAWYRAFFSSEQT